MILAENSFCFIFMLRDKVMSLSWTYHCHFTFQLYTKASSKHRHYKLFISEMEIKHGKYKFYQLFASASKHEDKGKYEWCIIFHENEEANLRQYY